MAFQTLQGQQNNAAGIVLAYLCSYQMKGKLTPWKHVKRRVSIEIFVKCLEILALIWELF